MKSKTFFLILFLSIPVLVFSQIGIKGDLSKIVDIDPGKSHRFRFTVLNSGPDRTLIDVRMFDFTGSKIFQVQDRGVPRSLTAWSTLNVQMIEVPGRGEFDLTCLIRVPSDPSLNGSYWGLIGITDQGPETVLQDGLGVNIKKRIMVLIRIDIKGTRKAGIDVLRQDVRDQILSLDLVNSGNVILSPAISLETTGGTTLRPTQGQKRLYPGQTVLFKIPLSEVRSGDHKGLLIIDAGGSDIWVSRLTFGFRGGPSQAFRR